MSQQLISRSADLKRLRDEGYEIEVRSGYLLIHHVPYVDSKKEIKFGKLISTLSLNNDVTAKPETHVISFMGEHPCNKDGTIIAGIQHASPNQKIFDDVILNFSFSNKPVGGYANYYEKITRYVEIISAQAKSLDRSVTAQTYKRVADSGGLSVFYYVDTNSSRANILDLNSKFKGQKVGIIGLGGTGAYVLDFVSKTEVDEIHLFDGDSFLQHNAFRSPSAPSGEILDKQYKKVEYFFEIYSQMHRGIKPHPIYVTEENAQLLRALSYVFVCVDKPTARGKILSILNLLKIVFIDTGLGVNIADRNLVGSVRVTTGTPSKSDHISHRIGTEDVEENEYATNIQIAELNAINASLAVIKWKKLCGFYQDLKGEHHSVYVINTGQMINEEVATQVC